MTTTEFTTTFVKPCLDCGAPERYVDGNKQPHDCQPPDSTRSLAAKAFWAGYDLAKEDG